MRQLMVHLPSGVKRPFLQLKFHVSRFKKIQKTKLKITALEQKLRLSQLELDDPKQDIKKERKDYEKEYLAQYKKQQKSKPKKGHQNS